MPRFHYFSEKLSPGFVSIYSSRLILRISISLMGLFLPIFLYEIFNLDIWQVLFYYFCDYLIYTLVVAPGAKITINKIGLRNSIIVSTIWEVLFYIIFFFLYKYNFNLRAENLLLYFLAAAIITTNLRRVMYWIPLHTDLAQFTEKGNRARELSFLEASCIASGALMPLVGGWILFNYNYDVLFLFVILLSAFSVFPLFNLPKTEEKYSWTMIQTWKEFFSKKRIKSNLAFAGDGAENVVGGIIWPIFIWQILEKNYLQVGAISSLIVISTVVLQLFVGRYADARGQKGVLRLGTILYSLGWLLKMFIDSAFQIFIVSTYHNLTAIFTRVPFDTLNYEKAADNGHFVDEYTVVREMALNGGRVLIIVLMLALIPFFGLKWTFILAAISALLMNFLTKEELLEKRI